MKIIQLIALFLAAANALAFSGLNSFTGNGIKAAQTVQKPNQLSMYVKVVVGEGEPVDSALQRFRRQVNRSGHLMVLRHRRYFENNQEEKNP